MPDPKRYYYNIKHSFTPPILQTYIRYYLISTKATHLDQIWFVQQKKKSKSFITYDIQLKQIFRILNH